LNLQHQRGAPEEKDRMKKLNTTLISFRLSRNTRTFSTISTSSSSAKPIGIVLMNMGGPSSLEGKVDGVEPFLTRLFTDHEIIGLPKLLQPYLGPFIAKRRSPRIIEQYKTIGGKSPIGDWTEKQGNEMIRKLEAMSAAKGVPGNKFKFYTCFRYAPPLTEDCLQQMAEDGIERAVAFSQYPHFSCTTTGSSLNHLWRESIRLGLEKTFKWSLIDRWPTHPTFISAVARNVAIGLERFPESERDKVIVVFSAHSVPMLTVNKGDQYVQEVSATVSSVMDLLRSSSSNKRAVKSPYSLAWQSKVGFLPWMGPPTSEVIKGLGKQGHRYILLVPIAFTSDHVETLYEIDVEYKKEAHEAGFIQFERAPSLNDCDLITSAQAEIVAEHLGINSPTTGSATAFPNVCSPQYKLNCAGCINPTCRSILNPELPSDSVKLRDSYSSDGCQAVKGSPWPKGDEIERLKGLKGTPSS
jgi:protoporphyrin/coproporphyrin ferrochelatase